MGDSISVAVTASDLIPKDNIYCYYVLEGKDAFLSHCGNSKNWGWIWSDFLFFYCSLRTRKPDPGGLEGNGLLSPVSRHKPSRAKLWKDVRLETIIHVSSSAPWFREVEICHCHMPVSIFWSLNVGTTADCKKLCRS